MIESILLATDGSDAASAAERYGVALAARLRARLQGVTVVEDRWAQGLRAEALGIAPPAVDGVEAFLKARAEGACRRVGELARNQGMESLPESVRGIADERIVDRGQGVELLVLGRDGAHAAC